MKDFLKKPSIALILFFLPLTGCLLLTVSCGKRRPPTPPATKGASVSKTQVTGIQRGDKILLQIPIALTKQFQNIKQADIFRLAESVKSPIFLTEDEFASSSTLIGSINFDKSINPSESMSYQDSLNIFGEPRRLRYAIRLVNNSGQKTAFSNFLLIEPVPTVSQPPLLENLTLTQENLTLSFATPLANIDETKPANIIGYNFYRINKAQAEANVLPELLNSAPLLQTTYIDKNFKFGETYSYFVRSVSSGTDGKQIESSDSNQLVITPRDSFPPAPPVGLTIAGAPGKISLFFAAGSEIDIAGYNVYRSTDERVPAADWLQLNSAPITATTFQDSQIETGQKYFYYVKAVDLSGNISAASDKVFETAP